MSNTIERFSDRVANYVRYRPGYPAEALAPFRERMGIGPGSAVADIGSGTGISSAFLVGLGCRVIGVEPNAPMRAAAEEMLSGNDRFESVDGTAEDTTLPDGSVDLVAAAQAFHWFDPERSGREFRRILRPNGFIALVWNERLLDADPFHVEYERLLLRYARDYQTVRHDRFTAETLGRSFGTKIVQETFRNRQIFDFDGLKGRMLSASYMPSESDPVFPAMIEELRSLFANHAENDRIQVLYQTNVFYTQI